MKTKEEKQDETRELHLWLFSLWDKMPKGIKKCKSCSGPVFGDFKPIYFDHLLEKEKYPQYKMTEANIWFCCGDCHYQKTSGFFKPKHLAEREKVLDLHKKGEL